MRNRSRRIARWCMLVATAERRRFALIGIRASGGMEEASRLGHPKPISRSASRGATILACASSPLRQTRSVPLPEESEPARDGSERGNDGHNDPESAGILRQWNPADVHSKQAGLLLPRLKCSQTNPRLAGTLQPIEGCVRIDWARRMIRVEGIAANQPRRVGPVGYLHGFHREPRRDQTAGDRVITKSIH